MASGPSDGLYAPRANEERFCPYHGGRLLLADCPIVATNKEFNRDEADETADRRRRGAEVARGDDHLAVDLAAGLDVLGADVATEVEEDAPEPRTSVERSSNKRRMAADVIEVGTQVTSRVDGARRMVLALGPGYERKRMRSPKELKSPAEMALGSGGPIARPVRACPRCRHPLPATIDYRDAYPVALIGHAQASKTSTVVALIDEAGHRDAEEFGVSRLAPTGATTDYLYSLKNEPGGTDVFTLFRNGEKLPVTQRDHHPPLEFITTLGVDGASISVLLQDVSGEDLMDPDIRLRRAPSVLWADAILFIYNPENSPAQDNKGRPGQASLLNGLRDDLEARGPRDASGHPYRDPPLLLVVSKADLLTGQHGIGGRPYGPEDVQAALRELGDGAVVNAAKRFPTVHWLFSAPMPEAGGRPQGVVELFKLLLEQLR